MDRAYLDCDRYAIAATCAWIAGRCGRYDHTMAKEKFALQDGEELLRESRGIYLKGKIRGYQAKVYLTDQRLVVATTGIQSLGLIGMLFNKQGTVQVSLGKSDVEGVEETTHLKVGGVMQVNRKDGDPIRVRGPAVEEWKGAIESWAS